MNENDDPKIRELLKKSPPLTPPESFYQGVLDTIERKHAPASAPTPWYWGVPARLAVSACLIMVIVLVARDRKPDETDLVQRKAEPISVQMMKEESRPASAPVVAFKGKAFKKDLSEGFEVQSRVNKSIAGYVDNPSPFEDVDKEDQKILVANSQVPKAVRMESTTRARPADYPMQARDTVNGIASQASFMDRRDNADEWTGSASDIKEPRTDVIRTQKQWKTLWALHSKSRAPKVDFEHSMVVGIFVGEKPTSGYNIDILDTSEKDGKLVVFFREAPGSVLQVMTQPYALRVIPKSNLPVVFEKVTGHGQ